MMREWAGKRPLHGYTFPCTVQSVTEKKARYTTSWDAAQVLALRRHMGLSQDALAEELADAK